MSTRSSENMHRIVLAGCGVMAHTWADYVKTRPDAEIVALVDLNVESAKSFAEKYGLNCPLYTDIETAVTQNRATLVFDVTVPAGHHTISTSAMRLGCDVFSEKPLAETLDQCRDIVRTSAATGRFHAVMQNQRMNPQTAVLKKFVREGVIGRPGFIAADFFIGAHFGGFRDAMDHPLLLDMAIHTFDQARNISGADPVSVYCHEFNPHGSWYGGKAAALCIFEMSDGSVFQYRGLWCAEGVQTPWEATWRIVGDKGTALWDGKNPPYAEVLGPEQQAGAFHKNWERVHAEPAERTRADHHAVLDGFFSALEQGKPAETNCADNILSIAMVFGAIESAASGTKINISV